MESHQSTMCSSCRMILGNSLSTQFSEHPAAIAFLKLMPSLRDDTAFSDEYGAVIRRIIANTPLDPRAVMYVYALNCSGPPPKINDIRACNSRLMKDLRAGNPKIVVPLGTEALKALDNKLLMKNHQGRFSVVRGFNVIAASDPESVIKMPDMFRQFRRDICFAIDVAIGRKEPVVDPPIANYRLADTQDKFDLLMEYFQSKAPKYAAVDIETTGLNPTDDAIISVSISIDRGVAFIIDWVNLINENHANHFSLDTFFRSTEIIYHHGMFDDLFLQAKGMRPNFVHDTMLSAYALNETKGGHSLKVLSSQYYQAPPYDKEVETFVKGRRLFQGVSSVPPFTLIDWEDPLVKRKIAEYNGADSDYTLRLHEDLTVEMEEDGVAHLPKTILVPAAKHFLELKQDGMLVDQDYHEALGRRWDQELKELESKMRAFPGAKYLNLGSPKQVATYLYDELKLRPMSGKVDQVIDQDSLLEEIAMIEDPEAQNYFHTSSSAVFSKMTPRSTSMFMLFWLADQHEFPRYLVRHRLISKKYGAYYEGIKKLIDRTGRIKPDYKIHGTRTGRLSSTNPNVHGTPRIKEIRRCYVPGEGKTIIAPDYSQAEVRMMAHFAGDERLIEALHQQDIHFEISKELFGMTSEEMNSCPPEEKKLKRRAAKTICFGLIYGRGHKSLATQMGVSLEEADEFIERFFLMMPKVRSWIRRQESTVMRKREVVSLYGRKRRFPFLPTKDSKAKARRQAVNFPIQSSVSDMTLLANIDILKELKENGVPAMSGFHIHDGFLFVVPDEDVEQAIEVTKKRMGDVGFDTQVPFASDVEIGKTWGDLKSV